MQTDRRTLLKSLAAAGLAVSGMGWAHAAGTAGKAAAAAEVLALTSAQAGSALEAAFITGVQSSAQRSAHTGLQGLDSQAFTELGQLLADGQDTLLVGLLDDASATLVLDLVRSAGGRVLSEEHHRVDAGASQWAQQLGQSLATGNASNARNTSNTITAATGNAARVSFSCVI